MVTVREVETRDVHASIDHVDELINLIAGRAEGADDFGFAKFCVDGFEDVGELDACRVSGWVLFHMYRCVN